MARNNPYRQVVFDGVSSFHVLDESGHIVAAYSRQKEALAHAERDRKAKRRATTSHYNRVASDGRGGFDVIGPDGTIHANFADRKDAEDRADSLNQTQFEEQGPALIPTPEPPTPPPPPIPPRPSPTATPKGGRSPLAFEVIHFGDAKDGYGVFDHRGGIKAFGTKAEAERHAAKIKNEFEAQDIAGATAAASAPSPIPPSAVQAARSRPTPPGIPVPSSSGVASAFGVPVPASAFRSTGVHPANQQTPIPGAAASPTPAPLPGGGRSSTSNSGFQNVIPPSAFQSTGSHRGPIATAFEQAFNASIGKAIIGAQKIVLGAMGAFRQGFTAVQGAVANPRQAFMAASTSASRTTMAATVVAAFAAARAKGFFGSAVAGVGGIGTSMRSALGSSKGARRRARQANRSFWTQQNASKVMARAKNIAMIRRTRRSAAFASVPGVSGIASVLAGRGLGVGGLAGRVGLGELGIAVAALTAAVRLSASFAENQWEKNRPYAAYSGQVGTSFAMMALHDQMRQLNVARSVEGTVPALAEQVNALQNGFTGFEKFGMNLGNRLATLAGAYASGPINVIGNWLGQQADAMNKADPKGDWMVRNLFNPYQDGLAGLMGGILGRLPNGFLGLGTGVGFLRGFDEAVKDLQRQRQANAQAQGADIDMWTQFMADSMNVNPGQMARPMRP